MVEKTNNLGYAESHKHPVNRVLHAVGIPVIAGCAMAAIVGPDVFRLRRQTAAMGVAAGVGLLVLGHAIEGNRPAILANKRAVVDAVRWWAAGAARLVTRMQRAPARAMSVTAGQAFIN